MPGAWSLDNSPLQGPLARSSHSIREELQRVTGTYGTYDLLFPVSRPARYHSSPSLDQNNMLGNLLGTKSGTFVLRALECLLTHRHMLTAHCSLHHVLCSPLHLGYLPSAHPQLLHVGTYPSPMVTGVSYSCWLSVAPCHTSSLSEC